MEINFDELKKQIKEHPVKAAGGFLAATVVVVVLARYRPVRFLVRGATKLFHHEIQMAKGAAVAALVGKLMKKREPTVTESSL